MMAENQSSEIFASPRECNSINYQLVCLPLINRSLRHYSLSLSLFHLDSHFRSLRSTYDTHSIFQIVRRGKEDRGECLPIGLNEFGKGMAGYMCR